MTLKQARNLLKLSQDELARRAGVNKFRISAIESGKVNPERVSHETVTRLVRAFQRSGLPGLTADELFPVRDKVA